MIDDESAEIIANAVWNKDIQEMSPEELDELAILQWHDDPEVEFDELGLSVDAGAEGHGSNTEEEMMYGPDGKEEEVL